MSRSLFRTVFLVAFFLLVSSCANAQRETSLPTLLPGDTERSVMVNGLERSYLLHIPPGINSQQSVPIAFAFHGFYLRPIDLQVGTEIDDFSNLSSFLVVYPEGVGLRWNVAEIGPGDAIEQNVDELAFVEEILLNLDTIANIDPKRIYAIGHSMGGALVYQLACEMPETFAAVASVAGPMEYSSCNPDQAVSVIHFHGLKDQMVPFSGGGENNFPPSKHGIDTWADLNDCLGANDEKYDENGISHLTYTKCQDRTAVELYTSDTGIHPSYSFGPVGIPVIELTWDFFKAHPKP